MAYRRREISSKVDKAVVRQSAMEQIDTDEGVVIDYGGKTRSITSATMQANIVEYTNRLKLYNQKLELADATGNDVKAIEKVISADNTAVLKSAVGKFGANSNQVEMLGGTRTEERKRPRRKSRARA